jgi:hypothetical protein
VASKVTRPRARSLEEKLALPANPVNATLSAWPSVRTCERRPLEWFACASKCPRTPLRRWARHGFINATITAGGHYRYNLQKYLEAVEEAVRRAK